MDKNIRAMARKVKDASIVMASIPTDIKNKALESIAESLDKNRGRIIRANKEDTIRSKGENLSEALLKRLKFDDIKIDEAIEGVKSLANLEDPVGKTLSVTELDEGLMLYKVTCPIGVIGVIFESRPDALIQISTLCLKSGNTVILKGGSEARETNRVLTEIIEKAAGIPGMPDDWIKLLETRQDVNEMLKLDEYIDLIIPRGSNEFVKFIMSNSKIPVMGHADGICHCYVEEDADLEMAKKVVVDSKTQYAAVCNAAETLLVHRNIAERFLPTLKDAMDERHVELAGCPETCAVISVLPVGEGEWKREHLDLKMSIKIVNGIDEAIRHINKYGSGHTDIIITENSQKAGKFLGMVDSGSVFWNCSTRFNDGFRFGLGAEVGISTSKLHARGPVGLEGLVIYKYLLIGKGHIVDDYAKKEKTFKHIKMEGEFPLKY